MIAKMKSWFERATREEGGSQVKTEGAELQAAAAALLVEAAMLDGSFDQDEENAIVRALEANFDLGPTEAQVLVEEAREDVADATDFYRFTRVVKDRMPPEERGAMMEMLWEVAYADGHLHDYEANLVRRVAGLLHVPDQESGAARKRVLSRLEATDTTP